MEKRINLVGLKFQHKTSLKIVIIEKQEPEGDFWKVLTRVQGGETTVIFSGQDLKDMLEGVEYCGYRLLEED